jgi:CheY-like chemotaxis protein
LRLLVIEDEERLAGILKSKLGEIGFTVDIAGSAEDGSIALELINYDAAVLDLALPDGDGLTVLTAARAAGKALPILILTARDAVEDRVAGLGAGDPRADDSAVGAHRTEGRAGGEVVRHRRGAGFEPDPSTRSPLPAAIGGGGRQLSDPHNPRRRLHPCR